MSKVPGRSPSGVLPIDNRCMYVKTATAVNSIHRHWQFTWDEEPQMASGPNQRRLDSLPDRA